MANYVKLFSHILQSTIWHEDDHTRIVWITMLALKDQYGKVLSSLPGLAHAAHVPIESVQKALKKFLAPDEFSQTKDFEGRRIEEIDGGWQVLNHLKYKKMMNAEDRAAQKRNWWRDNRSKEALAKKAKMKAELDKSLDKLGNLDTAEQSRCLPSASEQASEPIAFDEQEEFWDFLAVFLKRQRLLRFEDDLRKKIPNISLEILEKLIALTIAASRKKPPKQKVNSVNYFTLGIDRENYEEKDLEDAKAACFQKFNIR